MSNSGEPKSGWSKTVRTVKKEVRKGQKSLFRGAEDKKTSQMSTCSLSGLVESWCARVGKKEWRTEF